MTLMKWSRSCLINKERTNDVSTDWYNWRIDRTMYHLVVKDENEKFPFEGDAPKGWLHPHSRSGPPTGDQVDLYTKTLDDTMVGDHRDQPIEVQANGIPVVVEEDASGANDGQATAAAEAGTDPSMPSSMDRAIEIPRQRNWVCANCGERGHTLGDFVTPTLAGCDIDGCPMCNTKGHSFDECHDTKYLSAESVLNILYFRRSSKCQIRSDREIFVLLKQYIEHHESQGNDVSEMLDADAPWTRSFTFAFMQKSENLEKLKAYGGYGSATHQPVEEDPSVTQEDILAGKISSAHSSYHQKKEAAAYAAYLEKQERLRRDESRWYGNGMLLV
ncbi:hypothetical protein PG997_001493 [Apiospora hydei]|uniref:CCHC-type domain-containing protein n=1 Tax=Apiospora hydei TaxID=1337664 RepID=A0ABR1XDQ9_9PEZI